MKIEALGSERIADFVAYCKKHKHEVDESFLYDDDLRDFKPDEENPTYIVVNSENNIIATVSLIVDEYNKRGKKARFRIFHSEINDLEIYQRLMEAIIKHTEGLEKVFIFVPMINENLEECIKGLNFSVERYSYLLVREDLDVPEIGLQEGYELRSFEEGKDENIWCEVRNASFATLKGSETPVTPEMVSKMLASDEYIKGGLMILFHGNMPVGVIRGSDDEFEDAPIMNIGPIAVIPEYQGNGLGRTLLRAMLRFAKEKSYKRTYLCVNADNERAKALYLQEGFQQVEAVTCYHYDLT
ncbi:GNAT family N-acetyltransferase [Bacillus luteolus]|uniref:GNAT family N-acetyltransferase n=1 Tax=Litchfieldia luteola TaxID=682179 RepID=A0ABR9QQ81_9BACI|nr:GNAT family N-acetyltransferase [Cytobacillus luteolus]MBE4910675.1 GNAT family N-acetyltransferase [Cytobacillus luteolus]MBP1943854.1 mycothiol synthase [Cytobacillus luteolus]